ncbi:MAG: hypothetical protein J6V76_01775 [Bacteroidales bacterium]|nr:hypothetical protein [Bacteroidales bacterium]
MKNYLLSGIALMLVGTLATACNKDKNDDGPFDPGFDYYKPEIIHLDEIIPVEINESTFPDPVFRAIISTRDYDKNGDGTLDVDEIIHIRNIHCEASGVKSLQGIEYLLELRGIYCQDNEIEYWNLDNNKLLTGIWCSGNNFKALDFTGLDELIWVYCHDNPELQNLNVRNNPKMAYIECNTCPLKEIDVTHNPELEHLMCGTCQLTELDLSKNPKLQHLDAFQNEFTSLDLSNNKMMKRLDIWNNPNLGDLIISHMAGLQTYNCAKTGISKLDLSHNPELYKVICSYNQITELDLSKNPKLVILECQDNSISNLDLSYTLQLRFLWAAHNKFTSLDLGYTPYLIKVHDKGTYDKAKVDHEWYIDLGGEVSTGEDNKLYLWVNLDVNLSDVSHGNLAAEEKYSELDKGVKESDCLKRGYVLNVLYEMAGSPNVGNHKSSYKDVAGTTYEDAIIWGEMRAMTMGYPEFLGDYFNPNKWITRQDLMFMLMRYAEAFNLERSIDFGRSDEYIDYYDIDSDHWEAVCWCATWHIIEGKGGKEKSQQKIDPYGRITQADLDLAIANFKEVNNL